MSIAIYISKNKIFLLKLRLLISRQYYENVIVQRTILIFLIYYRLPYNQIFFKNSGTKLRCRKTLTKIIHSGLLREERPNNATS